MNKQLTDRELLVLVMTLQVSSELNKIDPGHAPQHRNLVKVAGLYLSSAMAHEAGIVLAKMEGANEESS